MKASFRFVLLLLAILCFLAGVYVLGRSLFLQTIQSYKTTTIVREFQEEKKQIVSEKEEMILANIKEYNTFLDQVTTLHTSDKNPNYEDIRIVEESNVFGSLSIPKLNQHNMILYLDDSSVSLASGVGHVENTSLPIGDPREHAVFAAHSGLENAKFFTHLDDLVYGDLFSIEILNRHLLYVVKNIQIVLPEETDSLFDKEDFSKVTLSTCYPVGINTHRLLVTGHLVELEKMDTPIHSVDYSYKDFSWLVFAFLILLLLSFLLVLFYRKTKKL